MAEGTGDFAYLTRWIASLKAWHIMVVIAIIAGLFGLRYLGGLIGLSKIDRTDYRAVADEFLKDNPTIANKLGKITSVSLYGAGGGAGNVSYNAYNVRGTDKSGICYVTLNKDDNGLWYVKSATLMMGAAEYAIPVSRKEEKRSLKLFGK